MTVKFFKRIGTAIFALLFLASVALNLHLCLKLAEIRDRRPTGNMFALKRDLPVYVEGTSRIAFSLPSGTLLQESSPRGMATLGKFYGHEFLLTIKQGNERASREVDSSIFQPSDSAPRDEYTINYSLSPKSSSAP